jgi:hypothetical protein
VHHNEELESAGLADGPWLVSLASVVCVDCEDSDDIEVASSDGGGRAAGRLCGGNLKSDRSGRVKWIEGPDMVMKRTRRDESMMG